MFRAAYHLINFNVWKNREEDEKIQAVKDAGYEGVEGIAIDYTVEPAVVKDRLDRFGLHLVAQDVPGPLMGSDEARLDVVARERIVMGQTLGCRTAVIMVGRTDGARTHTYGTISEHYRDAGRRLNRIGEILCDGGISLCVHNHINHMTETVEEMDILMQETDERWVGICFDTAHAVCGGGDPLAYARRFRGRIRHLHLKDTCNLLHGRPYFFKNGFLPLGKGVIDFPAILAALDGYQGWVTVEMDATFSSGHPDEEARTSRDYLHTQLGI